jgi:hypothetical protein
MLLAHKVPHHPTAATAQPIPHDQQPSREVAQEMFQKLHHLRAADRAGKQPRVEVPPRHPKSWERCLSISRPKTVVYVHGFENKDTLGNTLGGMWYYRVYRLWHCAGPAVPPMLFEHLDEGLRGAPLSEA